MSTEQRVHHYGGALVAAPAQRRRAAKKDRKNKLRPVAYVHLGNGSYAFLDDRYPV